MPVDRTVIYSDEYGPVMIKSYHFENENDEPGFYYFEGEVYLPKTYLKKELQLKPKELEKIIADQNVRRESVTNEYRTFTVYHLEDAKESNSKSLF